MLKNASVLVLKNIFFLKNLYFVESFVECKVSLADGRQTDKCAYERTSLEKFVHANMYEESSVGRGGFPHSTHQVRAVAGQAQARSSSEQAHRLAFPQPPSSAADWPPSEVPCRERASTVPSSPAQPGLQATAAAPATATASGQRQPGPAGQRPGRRGPAVESFAAVQDLEKRPRPGASAACDTFLVLLAAAARLPELGLLDQGLLVA